jgi:hypothetical protein
VPVGGPVCVYPHHRRFDHCRRQAGADDLGQDSAVMVLGAIRALCESNNGIYKTQNIAKSLGASLDDTADSLGRLENIGRVQSYDIGTTDGPGPGWRSKFR